MKKPVLAALLAGASVEQVLDGRAGQPPIGVVYRGWGGKSAAVAFRQGLGPELTTFVHMLLSARPADHTVVLCVHSCTSAKRWAAPGSRPSPT